MPKKEVDYSNTIIYKLCCNDINIHDIYIGHTTNFIQRKNKHKSSSKNIDCNILVYNFIRENGGWDNWSMIQIEEINCNNKREAEARERYWIDLLKSTLNSKNPYATLDEKIKQKQDWYEEHKEIILDSMKQHYEENKETKLQYQKQYAYENKEKIAEYQKQYIEENKEKLAEQKKIYREQHKEDNKLAQKKWREANAEKIKTKNGQIINCECGHNYTFGNRGRHFLTNIHTQYLDKLTKTEEELKILEETLKISEEEKLIKKTERLKEQQKIYREAHKETIKQYKQKHYQEHKEEIQQQYSKYREEHKEEIMKKQKLYIENNKEKIQQYRRENYKKNKEKILQNQNERITCDCGSEIRKGGKSEHCQSKKHQDYLISLTINT